MKRTVILILCLVACGARQHGKVCAGGQAAILDNDRCGDVVAGVLLKALFVVPYEGTEVTRYVESVGHRLARAAGDRRAWKFVILDDKEVNAFVSLGSTVYLYRGLLGVLRSEAELAGVIAHEMAHLRGGHARERWKEILRDTPRSAAQQMVEHKYARDDEIQADEHAVVLLARAGYDARAFATMLRAIAGVSDIEEDPSSVHPWWPERIARAQVTAALQRPGGELGVTPYRAGVRTLVAGRDPRREAVRIGGAAVIANVQLAIDLPAGTPDPDDPNAKTTVITPDGAHVSVIAVPTGSAWIIELLKGSGVEVEIEAIGSDTLAFLVEGTNAKRHIAQLRASKRTARPDELAQIRPKFVDLDAPRRLWSREP